MVPLRLRATIRRQDSSDSRTHFILCDISNGVSAIDHLETASHLKPPVTRTLAVQPDIAVGKPRPTLVGHISSEGVRLGQITCPGFRHI